MFKHKTTHLVRTHLLRMSLCGVLLLIGNHLAGAQNSPQPTLLELGVPIEREIAGGQKQSFQITLAPGQYFKVDIKQLSTEVRVSMIQPDGKSVRVVDSFLHQPLINFERVVELPGDYRLDVFSRSKPATGRYEIKLAELRPAVENDRALQQARESIENAMIDLRTDKYAEALQLFKRALEIRERVLGPESLDVAETVENVAVAYELMGDYVSAEPLFQRALKIKEKIHGPEHPAVAERIRELGDLYLEKGDYSQAEGMLQKALGIFERTGQADTINVAALLQSLGNVYYARDEYAKSESCFRRSIAILEKVLGPDHYHLVDTFTMLGHVAYDAGDYVKAEAMFQRSLMITEKALGQNLKVAAQLDNLGMLYTTTGDYAKAESMYRRALSIHQAQNMIDEQAPETPLGLARLYAVRGQLSEAVKFQTEASEIEERFVGLNLVVGSEREKLALLENLSWGSSRNISLHANLDPDDPKARELAINTILRHKGRVQDAMSAALTGLRLRLAPEDQKLLDQLNETASQLASLVLNGPGRTSTAEYQARIKQLEEQRGNLEAEVSRRTAGFYQRSEPVTVAAVQQAVPRNSALIEFAVYRPFDPKAPVNRMAFGEPHYVVYVVRSQAEIQWKELGAAKEIDELIDNFREALRTPRRHDVQQVARALDERIMQPVRALAGEAAQLIISPDGQLNLIPFAALVDEQGRYLVQRYSLVYVTSGRDLLRIQTARAGKIGPVVMANPQFGERATESLAGTRAATLREGSTARRSVTTGNDLTEVYFAPLGGTEQEALSIHAVFPEAEVLSGAQATESALKHLVAPRILHIATHGFFLTDSATAFSSTERTRAINARVKIENPLLRSGLALAKANLHSSGADDGILTALEASGLNLWGTKLVVLSACDTGVGEVRNGEGVYGLRRAFALAGAESLVMSLWPVSDYTTRTLMTSFYKNLKQGMGRSESLRQVQLGMLKANPKMHPFYWANFIESGQWAPLQK